MSAQDAAYAQIVDLVWAAFVLAYCGNATLTWLVYEYIITFTQEVELFWKRKVTGATVLFLVNRYLLLFYYGFELLSGVPSFQTSAGCQVFIYSAQIIESLQYLPWAAFSGLRTFALSRQDRKWPLAILVATLSCVPFGITLSPFADGLHGEFLPAEGCTAGVSMTESMTKILTIISRGSLISADIIVICVTLDATYRTRMLNNTLENRRRSFSDILFEYGILYFLIMLSLNILQLTFTMLSFARRAGASTTYVPLFMQPAMAIVASRFLLNLQSVNRDVVGCDSTAYQDTDIGTLNFANRVIGSTGSPLRRGDDVDSLGFDLDSETESPSDGSLELTVVSQRDASVHRDNSDEY